MIPDRLLENRQGALADLVLLKRTELSLVELGLGNVYVLTEEVGEQQQCEYSERRTHLMVEGEEGEQRWTRGELEIARVARAAGAQPSSGGRKVWRALPDWTQVLLLLSPPVLVHRDHLDSRPSLAS